MFDMMGIDITNPFQLRYKPDLPEEYFKKSGKLKPGYIRTGAPIEGMDLLYKDKGRKPLTAYQKGQKTTFVQGTDPFYIYQDPVAAAEARTKKIFKEQSKEVSASLAETMKIAEQAVTERTAAERMMEDYTNMLMQEADAKRAAEQEASQALRISEANKARSAMTTNMQIAPATKTPQTAGTQSFKRRRLPTSDIASPNLVPLNISRPNMLNI